jgi:hypothetical protein
MQPASIKGQQKLLTAKGAKNSREGREEVQTSEIFSAIFTALLCDLCR